MIRRRRPKREVTFSFDSFLDLISNVIGIIIRFILVAWVGAKAYTGIVPPDPPAVEQQIVVEEPISLPEISDPLSDEIEEEQRRLEKMQILLNQQIQQWEQSHAKTHAKNQQLQGLLAMHNELTQARANFDRQIVSADSQSKQLTVTLEAIRKKSELVAKEIEKLEGQPIEKKPYYYRTPISRPLLSEQVTFECQRDRISLLDIASLQEAIRRKLPSHVEELKSQWSVEGVTEAVGAFRLRYKLERKRDVLSEIAELAEPANGAGFRYGLSRWQAEPVEDERGETVAQALQKGSTFRNVMTRLSPEKTAVTLWVYPDSFDTYREVRNYLHDRGYVVAGRPLPTGRPIAASKNGSLSRGQ